MKNNAKKMKAEDEGMATPQRPVPVSDVEFRELMDGIKDGKKVLKSCGIRPSWSDTVRAYARFFHLHPAERSRLKGLGGSFDVVGKNGRL